MSISPVTLSFSLLVIFTAAVTPNPPDGFPQKMRRQPVGKDKTLNEEVQQLKKELQEFARSEVQQLNKDLQEFVRRCEQDKREKRYFLSDSGIED
ncbi:hypothetical protein BaRGS_00011768 [Batillaria attramentaria]|uniref:Uncharacterized protein n=1 Tax=Batillaria attramentaria TaxID=370345 RepID=A0ABD0LCL4_9CAEN